jgi:hypothetical protein
MLYCSRAFPLLAALGLFVFCDPSLAQVQLSKSTKAAHDLFLEGYARTNNKCESIDPPTVYVDQPPEHGIVCSGNADLLLKKTVENDLSQCLSRRAYQCSYRRSFTKAWTIASLHLVLPATTPAPFA